GIFARSGARPYRDGGVTMVEHMLQTAALAERAAPAHLVAAALLHDVGHFGTDFPENDRDGRHAAMLGAETDRRHEEVGARLLAPFFAPEVTEPIRLHVAAKRYLSAVEPGFLAQLPPQTAHTLDLQGGPMSPDEVAAFEANVGAEAAVKLRRWDEGGIVPGLATPDFAHYRRLIEGLLED
ncbi:MAG: HD domain-containing protein, partial [Alphaproteobacteria bacterium]